MSDGIEHWWHVWGRDGFGDPPDVDYWTEDEEQARTARDAGHKVNDYVPADLHRGAVEALDAIAEVLDRGIPDDRKLTTVVRLVHAARSTTIGGQ